MSRPLCSVIIPVYHRWEYLVKDCLSFVAAQERNDVEVIVTVDDASAEEMREWAPIVQVALDRYDDHLLICHGQGRVGLWPNVNGAIREARGEWIHVLCDDDWIAPEFYDSLLGGLGGIGEAVEVACCRYTNVCKDGSRWTPPHLPVESPQWLSHLVQGNPLQLCAVVFRKALWERLGGFDEDLTYTADWDFYLRATAAGAKWAYCDEPLAFYRLHGANLSDELKRGHTANENLRDTLLKAINYFPAELLEHCLPAAFTRLQAGFLNAAAQAANEGNWREVTWLAGQAHEVGETRQEIYARRLRSCPPAEGVTIP